MKENFNIEELFKQKFDNFQPDVDPSVWANIQAGIGAGATSAAVGGISAAVKIGLISGGIIAASVATWYFGFYEPAVPTQHIAQQTVVSEPVQEPTQTNDELIIVTDVNEISTSEIPTEERVDAQPNTNNSEQTSNVVNNSGNASNTTVNSNNTGNTSTTTNPANGNSGAGNVTNDGNRGNQINNNGSQQTTTQNTNTTPADTETLVIQEETPGIGGIHPEVLEPDTKLMPSIDLVPNIFTPDGDGSNDWFLVKSSNIESFFIVIRDKNGKEIFKTNDKDFEWDGTNYSGERIEPGYYNYFIFAEGKDGTLIQRQGQFQVF